ncbi:MAG: hypothetical protein R2751_12705 [Bacteroidales bacterium]
MYGVIISLLPALAVSVFYFGMGMVIIYSFRGLLPNF